MIKNGQLSKDLEGGICHTIVLSSGWVEIGELKMGKCQLENTINELGGISIVSESFNSNDDAK